MSTPEIIEPALINHRFFHLFQELVDNGGLCELKDSRLPVYLVIKRHCDLYTGIAMVSHRTICELTDLKERTVKRVTRALEEEGWLENLAVELVGDGDDAIRARKTRQNKWLVKEKFNFGVHDGQPHQAVVDYVPLKMKNIIKTIAEKVSDLQPDLSQPVLINFNINGDVILQQINEGGREQ